MGTRSYTHIYDDTWEVLAGESTEPIVTIYGQYNGGLDWHGRHLEEFMRSGTVGNGIPAGQWPRERFFNGAGDFAVQLIVWLKGGETKPGNWYIEHAPPPGHAQEYNYTIRVKRDGFVLQAHNWAGELLHDIHFFNEDVDTEAEDLPDIDWD